MKILMLMNNKRIIPSLKAFRIIVLSLFLLCLSGLPSTILADSFSINLGESGGSFVGRMVQIFALVTVLSLAPAIIVMITSFVRIVVVLSILRHALGLQQSPPNMVITSLALFLTAFIMAPAFEQSYKEGIAPYIAEKIKEDVAFEKTVAPLKKFMLGNVREKDLKLFINISGEKIEEASQTSLRILIPAFMISELRRSFEIGFLIFLPFLVIDMVIASVLMSMGMMMLPPVMIAMPFKIIFFVLVDGWHLLCGSLVNSFKL